MTGDQNRQGSDTRENYSKASKERQSVTFMNDVARDEQVAYFLLRVEDHRNRAHAAEGYVLPNSVSAPTERSSHETRPTTHSGKREGRAGQTTERHSSLEKKFSPFDRDCNCSPPTESSDAGTCRRIFLGTNLICSSFEDFPIENCGGIGDRPGQPWAFLSTLPDSHCSRASYVTPPRSGQGHGRSTSKISSLETSPSCFKYLHLEVSGAS